MKKIAVVTLILAASVLGVAASWLYEQPVRGPSSPTPTQEPQQQTAVTSTASSSSALQISTTIALGSMPLAATTSHTIDWASISPSSITSGAGTPVTITTQISDPAVIRNSVNLLYVSSSGTSQIIGSLNDNGVNGDAVAGDNIFTTVTSFAQYPVGTLNLRISAAFRGSLLRTQTGVFELNVLPATSTTNWVTLTDSQRLFSVQVPSAWGLVVAETPGDDPGTLKNVHFQFPDGTIVFTISVDPTSSLDAIQNGVGPQPIFLGETGQYVFGASEMQVAIDGEVVSGEEIFQTLPQILATFKPL